MFHLPLCWKSQLKENKLSCLFERSFIRVYYNWSSLQSQCNVGCYMVWCVEIQAQMQQLLSTTVDLLSPLLPPTPTFTQDLSVMVAYLLSKLQLYTSPILLCFKLFHLFCLHCLFLSRPTNSLFYTYLVSTLLKWQAVRNSCGFCGDNCKAESLNLV